MAIMVSKNSVLSIQQFRSNTSNSRGTVVVGISRKIYCLFLLHKNKWDTRMIHSTQSKAHETCDFQSILELPPGRLLYMGNCGVRQY